MAVPVAAVAAVIAGVALLAETTTSLASIIMGSKKHTLGPDHSKELAAVHFVLDSMSDQIGPIHDTTDSELGKEVYAKCPELYKLTQNIWNNISLGTHRIQATLESIQDAAPDLHTLENEIDDMCKRAHALVYGDKLAKDDDWQGVIDEQNLLTAALVADNLSVFDNKGDWNNGVQLKDLGTSGQYVTMWRKIDVEFNSMRPD